jgi:hypothetical protein
MQMCAAVPSSASVRQDVQGGLPGLRNFEHSGDPGGGSYPSLIIFSNAVSRLAFDVDVDVDAGGPGFDPDAE